jgi:hypothetical protein
MSLYEAYQGSCISSPPAGNKKQSALQPSTLASALHTFRPGVQRPQSGIKRLVQQQGPTITYSSYRAFGPVVGPHKWAKGRFAMGPFVMGALQQQRGPG